MPDPSEPLRRQRLAEINAEPGSREALEAEYGQVWNTEELSQDFEVLGFMAPMLLYFARAMARREAWNSGTARDFTSGSSRTHSRGQRPISWGCDDFNYVATHTSE
jgi:hypothetical protein